MMEAGPMSTPGSDSVAERAVATVRRNLRWSGTLLLGVAFGFARVWSR